MRTFAVFATSVLSALLWTTLAGAMPGTVDINEVKTPKPLPEDHTGVAVNPDGLRPPTKRVEYEVDAPVSFPSGNAKMLGVKRAQE